MSMLIQRFLSSSVTCAKSNIPVLIKQWLTHEILRNLKREMLYRICKINRAWSQLGENIIVHTGVCLPIMCNSYLFFLFLGCINVCLWTLPFTVMIHFGQHWRGFRFMGFWHIAEIPEGHSLLARWKVSFLL